MTENRKRMTTHEILVAKHQAETLGYNLEVSKLQLKHLDKMLKNGYFQEQKEIELQDLRKEIARQEQNLRVFEKQAKTGVFRTI